MKALIFTNHLQSIPKKIIPLLASHLKIALDGGADCLRAMNIRPDILLGDFDSVANLQDWGIEIGATEPHEGKEGILIVPASNQNFTDGEKGILYCDTQNASSIQIISESSGRLDHTLYHCRMLRKYHHPERSLQFHTIGETACFLRNQTITLWGSPGDQCSIFAFPQGELTTSGLSFECNKFPLRFAESESICNQLLGTEAKVHIQGEALIILNPEVRFEFTSDEHIIAP